MKDPARRHRGLIVYSSLAALLLVAVVYLVWSLRPLILPIILGILLAYLFKPFKTAFKYRWIPQGVRVGVLFFILTSSLFFGISFIRDNIPTDQEKIEILIRMKYHFNEKFNKTMGIDSTTGRGNDFYKLISGDINPLKDSFNKYLELSSDQKESFLNFKPRPQKYYEYFMANNLGAPQRTKPSGEVIPSQVSDKAAVDQKTSFLKTLLNLFSIWFLLPLVFLFFLLDDGSFSQFYIRLVPNRYFELALTVKEEVDAAIGTYLRGISMECSLIGASTILGLYLIGVPFGLSVIIGVLTAVTSAIPFFGAVVSLVLGLGFAVIAEDIHPVLPFVNADNLFIAVFVVVGVVHVLDNILFQPVVLGGATDLHPLTLILGAMAGSTLFGMAGVILAVPAIVVMKVFGRDFLRGLRDYRII